MITHDDAVMRGYCPGSLTDAATAFCVECGHRAMFNRQELLNLHVRNDGDVIWVEGTGDHILTLQAWNTKVPGLLITRPTDWLLDEYHLAASDGSVLHNALQAYPMEYAHQAAELVAGDAPWADAGATDWSDEDKDRIAGVVHPKLYMLWKIATGQP